MKKRIPNWALGAVDFILLLVFINGFGFCAATLTMDSDTAAIKLIGIPVCFILAFFFFCLLIGHAFDDTSR